MCDGPCALPLSNLKELLLQVKSLDDLVKSFKKIDLN
jgi:2-dehydro-3-deoxyphosphooctonate aldolase (KDO 8-P synthase)